MKHMIISQIKIQIGCNKLFSCPAYIVWWNGIIWQDTIVGKKSIKQNWILKECNWGPFVIFRSPLTSLNIIFIWAAFQGMSVLEEATFSQQETRSKWSSQMQVHCTKKWAIYPEAGLLGWESSSSPHRLDRVSYTEPSARNSHGGPK